MLSFFSCGAKNSKAQINQLQQDTVQSNNIEKAVHNGTNFVTVFLDIEFSGEVQVFDKPNGKVVKTLKNNIDEEDFIMFDLLKKNDNMFYIVAYSSLGENVIIKGWIYKNNRLGIFSSTYNRDFILYKEPNNRKKIVAIDKEYNPDMYEVIDFEGRWLKIKAKINSEIYKGWIPPEMQCSNVYSTCS
jgi:hypothetical protein